MAINLKKFYDVSSAAEAKVQRIAAQINELMEADKIDDALNLKPDLEAAKADAKAANELYIAMKIESSGDGDPADKFVPHGGDRESKASKDLRSSDEYSKQFWDAFRNGITPKGISKGYQSGATVPLLMDALTETGGAPAGSEGGFLLPVDFDNMINEQKRQAVDLAPYTNLEPVTAYSGWRAVEVAAAALPFAEITESDFPLGERIKEMESPTFTKVEYALKKYGGYLPVANDLFKDTPASIMRYLSRWCGRKASLTNTSLVLAIVNALTPSNVTDWRNIPEALKTALNKSLDPAISASAKIFTNQSGFDLMDQLLDGTGRPILAPDPTNETVKRFKGREVVVVSDVQWPLLSSDTYTRFGVGSMEDLITFFMKEAGELASTDIGGTAWRNDNTEIRYILRANPKLVDAGAMKLLRVTMPA